MRSFYPLRLAVMVKEVGEVFEGLFEYFHARQVHDAEVVGLAQLKPPPRVIKIFF